MADNRNLISRLRVRTASARSIAVVGLGRFGSSLALTLRDIGHEVLGIDTDATLVARYADELTSVVQADSTDVEALRQLGVGDLEHAVVAIGSHLESSVLTTAAIADLGVPDIWAKAVTTQHARILERVGANHVVLPELEMGRRVAHLVTGQAVEYMRLDDSWALVETDAPRVLVGRTLGGSSIRQTYGVTVVCIKPADGQFTYATADTEVAPGDLLLVAGPIARAEAFAELE